jgi:hypothetical protein
MPPVNIKDLVARRSDLGTFLVHLTRDGEGETAHQRFEEILKQGMLAARSMFGHAKLRLEQGGHKLSSQMCVCFTETPLEHIYLLLSEIENRNCQFQPYGIAITKKLGRRQGINPVWYLDITPGHSWLATNVNNILDRCLVNGVFSDSDVERLVPFIEQMGTHAGPPGYRKEFWWEREWRHRGDFQLPQRVIGLCPAAEIPYFSALAMSGSSSMKFIDPRWGLEQIIANLAGFAPDDVEIL